MPAPSISDALGRAGGEPTEVADQGRDLGDAFARFHIGEDERPAAAHTLGVAVHDVQVGTDMGC